MTITAGTDTYGRVKTVGGTSIVTKFDMIQFFPLHPLQSFYYSSSSETKVTGIPFVGVSQTCSIRGIPLARIDRVSVTIAYLRAFLAALAGFSGLVTLIMFGMGKRLNQWAISLFIACFVLALAGVHKSHGESKQAKWKRVLTS